MPIQALGKLKGPDLQQAHVLAQPTCLQKRCRSLFQRQLAFNSCNSLLSEEILISELANQQVLNMDLDSILKRHITQSVRFFLSGPTDPILTSNAANRLLSRGHNFTPTPVVKGDRQLRQDLKRLEFRIYGRLLGYLIQNKEPSERTKMQLDLGLRPVRRPNPFSDKQLSTQLERRRHVLDQQLGLSDFVYRTREVCKNLLENIHVLSDASDTFRHKRWRNLPFEEREVCSKIRAMKLQVAKGDKGLGIVVFDRQRRDDAIAEHLQSENFEAVFREPNETVEATRLRIWNTIIDAGNLLLGGDSFPTDMRSALMEHIPDMKVGLCTMYVVWKIYKESTRPIVPTYNAPTALASRFVHEQLWPFILQLPVVCKDSISFTTSLEKIRLSADSKAIMICLDVIAMFPNIDINGSLEATRDFLRDDCTLPPAAHTIILQTMEWVLKSNYVEHNGLFYKQINGAAMGHPLSVALSYIYLWKKVEETVLRKWRHKIEFMQRFVDDNFVIANMTRADAHEFKADLEAQTTRIRYTMEICEETACHLDLKVFRIREPTCTRFEYRVHRKEGNPMLYLTPASYHAAHVFHGIIKGELMRYLLRSSREEWFLEDAVILHKAFMNRGYAPASFWKVAETIQWSDRELYRSRALDMINREADSGKIVFSTTIDPRIVTAIEYGLKIDLDGIRQAKTLSMSEEDQRILGDDLSSVFPGKGLIGLQAAPKLHNIIKIPKLET